MINPYRDNLRIITSADEDKRDIWIPFVHIKAFIISMSDLGTYAVLTF